MNRQKIYQLIDAERERQAKKWNRAHTWGSGDCSGNIAETVKAAVLQEETGEVARAVLEENRRALPIELVQVAAVAVAWLEGIDDGQADLGL